jgi:Tol biopolymer transport system component
MAGVRSVSGHLPTAIDGERKSRPLVSAPAVEVFPAFSPDGRWIAYQSNDRGTFEIYVQSFPGPEGRWQVSTEGGLRPRWSHDGRDFCSGAAAGSWRCPSSLDQRLPPRELYGGSAWEGP